MQKRTVGIMASATTLVLSTILLAGCGSSSATEHAQQTATQQKTGDQLPVIRWGVFKNYNPVFIAKEKGFFAKEGVQVDFVGTFNSGPAVIQAAGTGNVDAGHSAISGIVNAVNSGVPIEGVVDSQTEFKDAPLMQWFVRDDSPIKSAEDLKGKKIGVNSLSGSFYYTVLIYLKQHHMTKKDVQFVVMPHQNQEQALRSKQIDVAGLIDPYSIKIKQDGGIHTLFTGADVLGQNQFSEVFFRKDFAEKNPDAVKRFIKAYNDAIQFTETNPQEASDIMGRALGISANLAGVHKYTPHAEVEMNDVQFWIDQMRENGELKDGGKLKATDVATTEFAVGN